MLNGIQPAPPTQQHMRWRRAVAVCALVAWWSAMRRDHPRFKVTDVPLAQSERLRRRRRWYVALMGTCLALIVLAWNVVRLWSTTAAVVMSVLAAVIAPVAVIIANWGEDH
jgi:hypothetical protein